MKHLLLALITAAACPLAAAQKMPADVAGGKDHPALSRYAGSWLVAQELKDFDATSIPSGAKPGDMVALEGRVTRLYYLAPAGKSVLEVQRNYEQALEKGGAVKRDACAPGACGERSFAPLLNDTAAKQLASSTLDGWDANTLVNAYWQDRGSERYWYGTLSAAGSTLHVAVLSARQGLQQLKDNYVSTVVLIVEPKAMETGKVTVDANALVRGLQAEGRMALYGLFFDTGKSEIRPESTPQLDEMAKLLQSNPALRVFIVGHTDNQGALESNLALSRARAQAVVDALTKTYRIDARRLSAAGAANFAPLAANANEAGRARNRRVEMVLQ
jgi:OOP family OmpA-OmpF porin